MIRLKLKRPLRRSFLRLLIVTGILTFGLSVHLFIQSRYGRYNPQELINEIPVVGGGKKVHEAPTPQQPLEPFPDSPVRPPDVHPYSHQRPWLAAVISAAHEAEQRMLIRSTWMRLYAGVPMDKYFVLANPGPKWKESIIFENRTFGDLIVLDKIQEDDVTATTIKTLEFYKYLVEKKLKYEFVSKLDTDLFLNARGFYEKFLLPRISNWTSVAEASVKKTIIGELSYSRKYDLVFPHGSMYTMTWDMIELLVRLQDRFNVLTGEDMAVAALMLKGNEKATFVNFKGKEKFDYDDMDSRGDGTAWARDDTHPDAIAHAVTPDAVAIHKLKNKDNWQKVAACFDDNGVRGKPDRKGPEKSLPFSHRWRAFWDNLLHIDTLYRSQFQTVPVRLFKQDGSMNWVCGGLWNMGVSRDGTLHDLLK